MYLSNKNLRFCVHFSYGSSRIYLNH